MGKRASRNRLGAKGVSSNDIEFFDGGEVRFRSDLSGSLNVWLVSIAGQKSVIE